MKINYSIKVLGKKRPIISKETLEIEDIGPSVRLKDLIAAIVRKQVGTYNAKEPEISVVRFLLPDQIEELSPSGKLGFKTIYNENKADMDVSVQTALQAYEDGIYCVFMDDMQIEKLDDIIIIQPESTFSFVRLCFLAGSIW
jgi:hypothetical protein